MIFVRRDGESDRGEPEAYEVSDLVGETPKRTLRASTLVAATRGGPPFPLAQLVDRDPSVRDALARAAPTASVRRYVRARPWVWVLSAPPLLGLLELDRELTFAGHAAPSRLVVDLLFAAFLGWSLTRPTPRHPKIAGLVLGAIGARWLLIAGGMCGHARNVFVWAAIALSVLSAMITLATAPDAERMTLEFLGKLGIPPADVRAARRVPRGSPRRLGVTIVAASLFPAMLHVLHRGSSPLWVTATAVLAYAAALPLIVERFFPERRAPAHDPRAILQAVALGLVTTAALVQGVRHFFDAGTAIADCVGRLDDATRRLVAREAAEVSSHLRATRAEAGLVWMAVLVMPFAEERIFRGLLLDSLVRQYGRTYGLFASAAAFAILHLGVYQTALWQTLLLGLAFGLTYLEGGLLAAFVVHAVWNLMQLSS